MPARRHPNLVNQLIRAAPIASRFFLYDVMFTLFPVSTVFPFPLLRRRTVAPLARGLLYRKPFEEKCGRLQHRRRQQPLCLHPFLSLRKLFRTLSRHRSIFGFLPGFFEPLHGAWCSRHKSPSVKIKILCGDDRWSCNNRTEEQPKHSCLLPRDVGQIPLRLLLL